MICAAQLPYHHDGSTRGRSAALWPHDHCGRTRGSQGRERIYRVFAPRSGFLGASVEASAPSRPHLYLISPDDPARCVAHGEGELGATVPAGSWMVLVDGEDDEHAGPYRLDVGLLVPSRGPCAFRPARVARTHDHGAPLELPATGPVAREGHLVTRAEPAPYPESPLDQIDRHRARSQQASGLVMRRRGSWAEPEGGGTFFGAGVVKPELLSLLEESWYVTLRWTPQARPPPGTRMIARLPGSTRAVVLAAGHETGPSDLSHLGGVSEETHHYLGTTHLAPLTLGFAADPALPLGPRECVDDD